MGEEIDNERATLELKATLTVLSERHGYYSQRIVLREWYFDRKLLNFGGAGYVGPGAFNFHDLGLRIADTDINAHGYWTPPQAIAEHIKYQAERTPDRLLPVPLEKRNPNFDKFHSTFDDKLRGLQIDDTVRINAFSEKEIVISKATYLDQVGTNITPDEPIQSSDERYSGKTVRQVDSYRTGQIKPFDECVAANTIGVAAICIDAKGELLIPFREHSGTNMRTDDYRQRLGAMERGWHCFSSGVLEWRDIAAAVETGKIEEFCKGLTIGIQREIFYETGIRPEENAYKITPYAFARELKRPGKPQFFFLIRFHSLNSKEIMEKINDNIARGIVQEDSEYAYESMKLSRAHLLDLLAGKKLKRRRFWVTNISADAFVSESFLTKFANERHEGDGPTYELYGGLCLLRDAYKRGKLQW